MDKKLPALAVMQKHKTHSMPSTSDSDSGDKHKKKPLEELEDSVEGKDDSIITSSSEPLGNSDGQYDEMAAMPETYEEMAKKAESLRKRNAVYSKRKYYKKKLEVERLEKTRYELEEKNRDLKNKNQRLETLLKDAEEQIRLLNPQQMLHAQTLPGRPSSNEHPSVGNEKSNQLSHLLNEVNPTLSRAPPYSSHELGSISDTVRQLPEATQRTGHFSDSAEEVMPALSAVERALQTQQLSNLLRNDRMTLLARQGISPGIPYNPLLEAPINNSLLPSTFNSLTASPLQQLLLNNSNQNAIVMEHLLGRARQNDMLQQALLMREAGLGNNIRDDQNVQNNALIEYLLRRRQQQQQQQQNQQQP
jgi:hypothetical protein